MAPDDIRFGSLKEDRGWYFVEYSPPIPNYRFSSIRLSIVEERSAQDVARAMEAEAEEWLTRYAVPVMVTAYSLDETTFELDGVRPINLLFAWVERPGERPVLRWELVENEVVPDDALDPEFLEAVFADVPSRTRAEIQADAAKYRSQRKVGWWLVVAWSVVGPLGFAIAEYSSELLCELSRDTEQV